MPNKFEAWKQGLTLDKMQKDYEYAVPCPICPVPNYICEKHTSNCMLAIKEWGEQDAEQ